ncbi:MAG: OmpA family protein [Bacteroidia bacterium]|nr:OmpA family protein [Bacteroidia bacterium]
MKQILFVFCLIYAGKSIVAQQVQWASKVINYSSQAGEHTFSAQQVLAEPNSMTGGGTSGMAWSAKEDVRKEFLHVGFAKPMKIAQVIVAENANPGAVTRVLLYDGTGLEKEVYRVKADTLELPTRLLSIKFDMTEFEVHAVKIFVDCRLTPGENQIDAIGISSSHDELKLETKIKAADVKFYSAVEKLDDNINSKYTEVNPKISPDGKTLYVNRKDFPPHNDDDEIWYSRLVDGKWTKLQNMGAPLNNWSHNAVESCTPDGNTLLMMNQYYKETGKGGSGFSISNKTAEGWSYPENARIDNFINNDRYTGFYLANDGKTIVTQLRRHDTKGTSDLYVMFLQDDKSWTEPLRMGDSINTLGGECTAFLASDNVTLYFSTDGISGFGSNDIYMSRRKDDSWTNWTTPLNMGPVLNSSAWDAYYSLPASGDYAYFVRDGDVYRVRLTEEFKPKPVVLITGVVYNQKTKQPVGDAAIRYEYLSNGKEAGIARSSPETGEYKIVLPFGHQYGFMASAKSYLSVSDNMDLTNLDKYTEITRDLYLVPVEVGQIVRLNNIFFDFAKATLRPESYPELDRVVEFLQKNPTISIDISGHTDNVGSDADNLHLSSARAKAVLEYLMSKGIPPNAVSSTGFGETKPIAGNDTDEGRQLNRRVEFVINKL